MLSSRSCCRASCGKSWACRCKFFVFSSRMSPKQTCSYSNSNGDNRQNKKFPSTVFWRYRKPPSGQLAQRCNYHLQDLIWLIFFFATTILLPKSFPEWINATMQRKESTCRYMRKHWLVSFYLFLNPPWAWVSATAATELTAFVRSCISTAPETAQNLYNRNRQLVNETLKTSQIWPEGF